MSLPPRQLAARAPAPRPPGPGLAGLRRHLPARARIPSPEATPGPLPADRQTKASRPPAPRAPGVHAARTRRCPNCASGSARQPGPAIEGDDGRIAADPSCALLCARLRAKMFTWIRRCSDPNSPWRKRTQHSLVAGGEHRFRCGTPDKSGPATLAI